MSSKHLMIAVNWFGPYWDELEEIRAIARDEGFGDGLYMCIGKQANQQLARIQYIGIGNPLHTRLHGGHHKLPKVTRSRQIWLGEIASAEPSGKRMKFTKATLDYAEWMHAWFMDLPLNSMKKKSLPPRSVTVLNRWWKTDLETMRSNRPHPDWPNLIDFPGHGLAARTVWFGGGQRYFNAPDYR